MDGNIILTSEFARSLMPTWESEDWFQWPPDIFAFTSVLLQATGVYRYAVSPHSETQKRLLSEYTTAEKTDRLRRIGGEWYMWILGLNPELPAEIKSCKKILFESESELSVGSDTVDFKTCEALLDLHAMADRACANFGLMTASHVGRMCAIDFLANYLLAVTGSLSRLPRHQGVVLPKMRTPQRGLTIRSFSHHLTFHRSEAKVLWRSIPWYDLSETGKRINLVAVPVPYNVGLRAFRPAESSVPASEAKGFGYFDYVPAEKFEPDKIVGLLHEARKEVSQVHMLVFPELALTESDLEALQMALEEAVPASEIPMIITGIRGDGNAMGANKVRLSVYFARKWYNLGQEKHHRWKLDKGQIRQYSLGRSLDPDTQWWESMDIASRRLTFLVPNTWLSLCPLICEDLAQLEPISHLIRGVGPNLVIAILLDGPQLPQRWPARYVGVLADDPGSAVLTLTSLGMAVRCAAPGNSESRVIALWKGQDSSWAPIELTEGARAVLLSISAETREEFTADGRSDGGVASFLSLQEIHQLHVSESREFKPRPITTSNPEDLVDLTAFSFLTDAIIDSPSGLIAEFSSRVAKTYDGTKKFPLISAIKPFDSVWNCIKAESKREDAAEQAKPQSNRDFEKTASNLCEFIAPFNESLNKLFATTNETRAQRTKKVKELTNPLKKLQRWAKIAEAAIDNLESEPSKKPRSPAERERLRLNQVLFRSVLWAIFNRLERQESELTMRNAIDRRAPTKKKGADLKAAQRLRIAQESKALELKVLYDPLVRRVKNALADD